MFFLADSHAQIQLMKADFEVFFAFFKQKLEAFEAVRQLVLIQINLFHE